MLDAMIRLWQSALLAPLAQFNRILPPLLSSRAGHNSQGSRLRYASTIFAVRRESSSVTLIELFTHHVPVPRRIAQGRDERGRIG